MQRLYIGVAFAMQRLYIGAARPRQPHGAHIPTGGFIGRHHPFVQICRLILVSPQRIRWIWMAGAFYDRIIRNQRALRIVRRYIARNPAKWKNDRYFLNIRETNHHVRRGMSTV